MGSIERVVARSTPGRRWARTVAQRVETPTLVVAARVAHEIGLSEAEIDAVVGTRISTSRFVELEAIGAPETGWADPWLIGEVHEYAVSEGERQRRGAWYTPRHVATKLVDLTLDVAGAALYTVDPCCGGGGFLLAAAERLATEREPLEVLDLLGGHDIDAGAVRAARIAVATWAVARGVSVDDAVTRTRERVTQADSLTQIDETWPSKRCVVGNPPFASPLKLGAVAPDAERYRSDHSDDLGPYADLASLHLHRAVTTSAVGSVVTLVQPQSILAGRDGIGLRKIVEEIAPLAALWVTRRAVFDAGARVCAPVLGVGRAAQETVRLISDDHDAQSSAVLEANGPRRRSWSELAATALGAPELPLDLRRPVRTLGALATATAGFRDEFYGLAGAAQELVDDCADNDDSILKLLTVGSVEPLSTTWGVEPIRLAGTRWTRPVVRVEDLDGKVRRWTEGQLHPKVVLATQSKVLEPVIDTKGSLVPLTPLVSVMCEPGDLALVTAVLLSPPVVALAWQQTFGTAMSVDAVKLAARDVTGLPLPGNRAWWDDAACLLAEVDNATVEGDVTAGWALAVEVAELMTKAYGADRAVFDWWVGRAKKSWAADVALHGI